jgi:hypothetical protein
MCMACVRQAVPAFGPSLLLSMLSQYAVLRGYDLLRSGVLSVGYQAVWKLLSHAPLTDEEVCNPAGMLRPLGSCCQSVCCQQSCALECDCVPSQ